MQFMCLYLLRCENFKEISTYIYFSAFLSLKPAPSLENLLLEIDELMCFPYVDSKLATHTNMCLDPAPLQKIQKPCSTSMICTKARLKNSQSADYEFKKKSCDNTFISQK
jgi:hypothetical protein